MNTEFIGILLSGLRFLPKHMLAKLVSVDDVECSMFKVDEGGFSSVNHGHNSTARLKFKMKFSKLEIDYRVSSEECCDKGSIYIDGRRYVVVGGYRSSSLSIELPYAEHTVEIVYHKDYSVSTGEDRFVVYNIKADSRLLTPLNCFCECGLFRVGGIFAQRYDEVYHKKINEKDYALIIGGPKISSIRDEIPIEYILAGYTLFSPHSKEEYEEARDWLVSIGHPKKMGPLGIYKPTSGGSYSCRYKALRSDSLGADCGWKVQDGSDTWWASDLTNVSEPNGDYTGGCYLRIDYDDDGNVVWWNDYNCNYGYTDYLLVKRN